MKPTKCLIALTMAAMSLTARSAIAQPKDGLTLLPDSYHLQFENEWVRVVRAHISGNAHLPPHTHPAGLIVYLYLSDAGPVQFNHDAAPGNITRRAVTARSYRVGRATPETHEVVNTTGAISDFLRIELKTRGTDSPRQRVLPPPLKTDNDATVEVTSDSLRVTRLTIGAGKTMEVATTAANPALLVALTGGQVSWGGASDTMAPGRERFIAAGQRHAIHNDSNTAIEVLRVDFLSTPQ